jgi:hypothetical protein
VQVQAPDAVPQEGQGSVLKTASKPCDSNNCDPSHDCNVASTKAHDASTEDEQSASQAEGTPVRALICNCKANVYCLHMYQIKNGRCT